MQGCEATFQEHSITNAYVYSTENEESKRTLILFDFQRTLHTNQKRWRISTHQWKRAQKNRKGPNRECVCSWDFTAYLLTDPNEHSMAFAWRPSRECQESNWIFTNKDSTKSAKCDENTHAFQAKSFIRYLLTRKRQYQRLWLQRTIKIVVQPRNKFKRTFLCYSTSLVTQVYTT